MHLLENTFLQNGKYRILRYIGSGGFGTTYEAEQVLLGERVAIKEFFVKDYCNRDVSTGQITVGTHSKVGLVDKLKRKFLDEAKMLYRMQHPGIVRIFDIFEENGTAYFVMNYIDGPSLNEIVAKEGRLNEGRAVRYIRQIAEALKCVHDHGCLHLDIKPGNIIIDKSDHAILIDFGTSKQYDEVDGENTSTLLGMTPGYAPLEQIGNDVIKFTPATDIYALGATLYKLLTGITPLSANLLASGEALEKFPHEITQSTCEAVSKSMEVNKYRRPQSITEFVNILDGPGVYTSQVTNDENTVILENRTQNKSYNPTDVPQNYINADSKKEDLSNNWIVNLSILLLSVGALGIILLAIYGLFFEHHDAEWKLYALWWTLPMIFMGILVLIGLWLLYRKRLKGFALLSAFIPIVNLPFPVSVLVMYDRYELFRWGELYFWTIWVIAPIIGLLLLYGILNIKYEGTSAWSTMEPSPAWMKKVAWVGWILLGVAMFGVLP